MPLETIKDYNVSQKILHLGAFLKVFVSTVENYRTKFYTPVVRSIVRTYDQLGYYYYYYYYYTRLTASLPVQPGKPVPES